jgi:putative ABC transport system permease protein
LRITMKIFRRPPRIACWLIRRMFPDSGKCSVLGDMIETYGFLAEEKNDFHAWIWFQGQCLRAIPCYLLDVLRWRIYMFTNYLLVTIRNLKKNKIYSLLNIIGLAVGMTAFILIALYIQYELSFDKYHDKADRIYRVVREGRTCSPAPLAPALAEKIPEVESAARIFRSSNSLISNEQDHFLEDSFYWADPEIFNIFSIPFKSGDPGQALNEPYTILLSEKAARKYFGHADPIGKTLTISERYEFMVAGVFYDMPANSHFVMDLVVPYKTYFRITDNDIDSWSSNHSYTYLLLDEAADPSEMESKISPFIEIPLYKAAGYEEPFPKVYSIQPLTEIHLHSHRMQEIEVNNDIKYIFLFSAVAFLILFIACINYMNLATAQSLRRGKEVGLRKVVGAQKRQLIVQFLGESVAMTLIAMVAAITTVLLVLPAFNSLVERQLSLNPLQNPALILGLVVITLIVGLFAGSYPAVRISDFKPISVLRGTFAKSKRGSSLRNVLVFIQFAITIILIICTTVIRKQLKFIKTVDMGYTKEQIITLPVRGSSINENLQSIKTELLKYSGITAVSFSDRLPNNIDTFTSRDWTGRNPEEPIPIFYNSADCDFTDLYDLEIVQGRSFSRDFLSDEGGAFLVNETAVKVAGWESPIGRSFTHWNGQTGKIVGVLKDFHLRSLHSPIEPLYVYLDTGNFSNLSIKIGTADIPATLDYVEGVMKNFSPAYPFSISFFDEVFERAYFTEQRMARIFGAFAFLAIFIACLGLFGLTVFAAELRTREIGIRKVLGASDSNIIFLLSKEFLRWVFLANLIAWPIAFYAMNRWLQNFAYRTHIGIAVFLISGGAALAIAALTVSYQSIKSARTNTADTLRYE